ncbi:hypothetical protein K461DRAFT_115971 [Myriangium duriaei CBS 260.36]|uniref:Uncharacterized protein n=1 Tax=Myriangium duriaei CBS 260.36 TaxID=1168546 RepID=A0A9P4MNJ1_9PEZI|nr:hypothetical protein K461DRAFT_115971 [Myriangium duriaei CBS 260.36]
MVRCWVQGFLRAETCSSMLSSAVCVGVCIRVVSLRNWIVPLTTSISGFHLSFSPSSNLSAHWHPQLDQPSSKKDMPPHPKPAIF